MTKGDLKRLLRANKLPDDTEVLISVKKFFNGEATWAEIGSVDGTENGPPILIGIGDEVME